MIVIIEMDKDRNNKIDIDPQCLVGVKYWIKFKHYLMKELNLIKLEESILQRYLQ